MPTTVEIEKNIEIYENINKEFKPANKAQEKGKTTSKLLKGFSIEIEKIFQPI